MLNRALTQFAKAFFLIASAFVVLVGLFIAYVVIATYSAKTKAEAICEAIPIGTSVEKAQAEIASANTDPKLRILSPSFLSVGFYGAPSERWYCNISIVDGKVANQEIHLVD